MFKSLAFTASVVLAAACLPGAAALAAERKVTVKFAPGTHGKTIKGSVKGYDTVSYSVATVAGQTLHMLFKPSLGSCSVNVFAPGVAEAVHIGDVAGNEFGTKTEKAGAYRFQVGMMRSAARRGSTCRFELSLEITGAPGGASAGVSDLMMRDVCKGNAAPMYGVEPRNITAIGRIVRTGSGYRLDGTVNKGAEGIKKLRCIYKPDRTLDRVQAMTPDGRL